MFDYKTYKIQVNYKTFLYGQKLIDFLKSHSIYKIEVIS